MKTIIFFSAVLFFSSVAQAKDFAALRFVIDCRTAQLANLKELNVETSLEDGIAIGRCEAFLHTTATRLHAQGLVCGVVQQNLVEMFLLSVTHDVASLTQNSKESVVEAALITAYPCSK